MSRRTNEPPPEPISLIASLMNLENLDRNALVKEQNAIIKQIKAGNFIKDEIDEDDDTPLLIAIGIRQTKIALALIESGFSRPDYVNTFRQTTPLMSAIEAKDKKVAMALLDKGNCNPNYTDNVGNNALLFSCERDKKYDEIALKIIETGQVDLGHANNDGYTALFYSVANNIKNVATRLIESGQSNPGQPVKGTKETALIMAILAMDRATGMDTIAEALLNTGQSNPENVTKHGFTALMMALNYGRFNIAQKILATGQSNPLYTNSNGRSALSLAKSGANEHYTPTEDRPVRDQVIAELERIERERPPEYVQQLEQQRQLEQNERRPQRNQQVISNELTPTDPPTIINLNEKGFDFVQQNEEKIDDFLNENGGNICITVGGQNFLSSKENISKAIKDEANLKYECKRAGNNSSYILDSNIILTQLYLNMSPIVGMQIIVNLDKVKSILSKENKSKLFILKNTNRKAPAIIAKSFYDGRSGGESADHCQPGKETYVYDLFTAEGTKNVIEEASAAEASVSLPETEEKNLKIQYKGLIYTLNIDVDHSNIGNVKDALLQKLLDEGKITSIDNKNVKFIYKGKIYNDTSKELSTIPISNGETLQSMVSDMAGGTRRRLSKRKTHKRKIGKRRITSRKIRKRKTQKR